MKIFLPLISALLLCALNGVSAATLYVNATNSTPQAPYDTWTTAATNIQAAVDLAQAGDRVLVGDGVYQFGGKVMGGDLTNRVAVNKAITVESVNGPAATIIVGSGSTNGPQAIRCAWLANGAVLSGFTLTGGATRAVALSGTQDHSSGGGVFGLSTNATVVNCLLTDNLAAYSGGGAYQVALFNCTLAGNRAVGFGKPGGGVPAGGAGGGAAKSFLKNCRVIGNFADQTDGGGTLNSTLVNCVLLKNSTYTYGGAAAGGILVNCTIASNIAGGYASSGSAVWFASLTNCIIWGNTNRADFGSTNYGNSTLSHCVSIPLPPGVGNLAIDPQLVDGQHLAESSPCRGAGLTVAQGTDLDGQPWANPPSIGCDEWYPEPVALSPVFKFEPLRRLKIEVPQIGAPASYTWFFQGVRVEEGELFQGSESRVLTLARLEPELAGEYWVVVSNAYGRATSEVAHLRISCVVPGIAQSAPPYTSWSTAADNIQAAVDAAVSGQIILLERGFYSTGGKTVFGDLLNRVAIDKPVVVTGIHGPGSTVIEGAWDPLTNGPASVRGVWMGEGATLSGVTVRRGSTRGGSSLTDSTCSGGGVFAAGPGALLSNCILSNNAARWRGGALHGGKVQNSLLVQNATVLGDGGAAYGSELWNCTVIENSASMNGYVAGVFASKVRNSIVAQNYSGLRRIIPSNFGSSDVAYSCSESQASGTGNIAWSPVFLDPQGHLPAASPVRGAGSVAFATGRDLDGEPWAEPPSMGADEIIESNLVGDIVPNLLVWHTNTYSGISVRFQSLPSGKFSRMDWNFGDGQALTNATYFTWHVYPRAGEYTATSTVYNADHPQGVTASVVIRVMPIPVPQLESPSLGPDGFSFGIDPLTGPESGILYTFQYATNLVPPVTWHTFKTLSSLDAPVTVTDPGATNSASRFYRIQAR